MKRTAISILTILLLCIALPSKARAQGGVNYYFSEGDLEGVDFDHNLIVSYISVNGYTDGYEDYVGEVITTYGISDLASAQGSAVFGGYIDAWGNGYMSLPDVDYWSQDFTIRSVALPSTCDPAFPEQCVWCPFTCIPLTYWLETKHWYPEYKKAYTRFTTYDVIFYSDPPPGHWEWQVQNYCTPETTPPVWNEHSPPFGHYVFQEPASYDGPGLPIVDATNSCARFGGPGHTWVCGPAFIPNVDGVYAPPQPPGVCTYIP